MPNQSIDIAELLKDGLALHQTGRVSEAKIIYNRILQKQSKQFDALQLLGIVFIQQKNPELALEYFDQALRVNQTDAMVFNNRGIALRSLQRFDLALSSYDEAIRLNPDYAEAYYNRANTLRDLKRFEYALKNYNQAIQLKPDYAQAHNNRGLVLQELKRLDEALNSFNEAVRIKSDYAEAYGNLGNIFKELDRLGEALRNYDKEIFLKPEYAEAHNNRGIVLRGLSRMNEALCSFSEAIRLKSGYVDALYNQGITLQALKRFDEALDSYHAVIRYKPDHAESYNNRGIVFQLMNRLDDALSSYDEAIRFKPDYADAYNNRGNVLKELSRFDEALNSYNEALRIKPDYEFLFGIKLHMQMKLCDWTDLPFQLNQLESSILANQKTTVLFPLLALLDKPELHLLASKVYVKEKFPSSPILERKITHQSNRKIRIGYYSSDFYNHALSCLMAELFQAHDPNRFEIYGFSFKPHTMDELRQRVSKGFEIFFDVSDWTDLEIISMSSDIGIDIAVDLNGFTQHARVGIFASRCAPIQVSYLGYPGTMGAPYIDYIVADHTVIPIENQKHFTEKIVYMPHSYQVNDSARKISNRVFTRKECGLPEEGFVFCCFNNNYKILPATFEIWMRILQSVSGSVLWLFEDNPIAAQNLRKEAGRRGVESSRLVFAKRMNPDEHLARHRLADLFIDTWPYNAHTTASDALWARLPVLTLMGQSFASRVAASLLKTLDLGELITITPEEYEARAIDLALHPIQLKQLRAKLESNRLTSTLFDGHLFVKHLESAYIEMYERAHSKLPAAHIAVRQ